MPNSLDPDLDRQNASSDLGQTVCIGYKQKAKVFMLKLPSVALFKINFFKIIFQEHYPNVKRFGSRRKARLLLGAREFIFGLKVYILPYFESTSSECSAETARTLSLA